MICFSLLYIFLFFLLFPTFPILLSFPHHCPALFGIRSLSPLTLPLFSFTSFAFLFTSFSFAYFSLDYVNSPSNLFFPSLIIPEILQESAFNRYMLIKFISADPKSVTKALKAFPDDYLPNKTWSSNSPPPLYFHLEAFLVLR